MKLLLPFAGLPCLLVTLLLVACAQPAAPGTAPSAGQVCRAQPAQFAVGRQLTEALLQEAQRLSGASHVRVLRPGQVHTMEFDERRLNVEVDAGQRVIRATCG